VLEKATKCENISSTFSYKLFLSRLWNSTFHPASNVQNDNTGEDPRNRLDKTLQILFPGSGLQEIHQNTIQVSRA